MDSGLLVALEMGLVLAGALGWALYEILSLRRARRRRAAAEAGSGEGEGT